MGVWLVGQSFKTLKFGLKIPGGSRICRSFEDRLIWDPRVHNYVISRCTHSECYIKIKLQSVGILICGNSQQVCDKKFNIEITAKHHPDVV